MDANPSAQETRLHFLDYWRVIKARRVIVFLVFLLVVLTVFTVTLFQERVYVAATRIKVEQEKPNVAVFEQVQTAAYDPYFLQTQYEIIQSQKILYPVIERLGLQRRWGPQGAPLPLETAFRVLKQKLSVRRYRDTSLIEIAVYDRDPRLAADIANLIAEVFERDRLEVKRQQTQKGLEKLREEADQQYERLRQAQEKVERLRKELNVPVFGTVKLNDLTLQQLEQQLTAARVETVTREARLNELRKLTPEQLRNAIATIIVDPNVQTLLQDLTNAETRLETLKEDYGPDHPVTRSVIALREKLLQQLNERLEGIKRGFEIEYQVAKARLDELQKQMDEVKTASLILEGEKYLPFRNAQREEELETRLYDVVKARLQQTSIEMEVPRSPVEVIDRAEPPLPHQYVRPNLRLNLALGVAAGLILGVALAFFFEFLDTSVKKIEDVERYLGLPVLGVIGQQAGLLSTGDASAAHVEAYRMLRTNIEFAKPDGSANSLCVLSPGAGEGKSFTIANLACVYAQHGAQVLVVDSDLRRPGVHEFLGVRNDYGLADYLRGEKSLQELIQAAPVPGVYVLAAGAGATARAALPLLSSVRMLELVQQLGRQFDIVLYDTPPVLGVSDAAVLSREVGQAILVVQHRRYPRAMARRAVQVIQNAGGRLLGVVVNNVHLGQDETYYYYHDLVEQYARSAERAQPSPAAGKKSAGDEINLSGKY
jgi:succinoglycan biosynthesis transport protein ExoP